TRRRALPSSSTEADASGAEGRRVVEHHATALVITTVRRRLPRVHGSTTDSLGRRFEGPSPDRSTGWTGGVRTRGAPNESGPPAGSRTRTPDQGPCAAAAAVLAELAGPAGDRPHRRAPAAPLDGRDRTHHARLLAVPRRRSIGQGPDGHDRRQRWRVGPADGRHGLPLSDPGRPAGHHRRALARTASRPGDGAGAGVGDGP